MLKVTLSKSHNACEEIMIQNHQAKEEINIFVETVIENASKEKHFVSTQQASLMNRPTAELSQGYEIDTNRAGQNQTESKGENHVQRVEYLEEANSAQEEDQTMREQQ